jgi:superfamily II DNA or RNA helicase
MGKTVIGTALIARRARNTLVLVRRRPLQDQWRQQLARFLGMDLNEIGEIRGQKSSKTGRIDVAMLQSLLSDGGVKELVAQYGHVIVDECHHVPATSFERVLSAIPARYVTGLTATPHRQDGHDPIIRLQLGPTRFKISAKSQIAAQPLRHLLIVRSTGFVASGDYSGRNITELYSELAKDARRNDLILDDVIATIREGRSPLILTERKEHVEFFAGRLERYCRNLFVLTGGTPEKARRELAIRMSALSENEPRTIVATGKFVGEGFDDAKLDTLFLTLPVSWKGVVDQYVGRLHRIHAGKLEVRVFDYVDQQVPRLCRMFDKRLKRYRSIGYTLGELPDEFELCADPDIEADLADIPLEFDENLDD